MRRTARRAAFDGRYSSGMGGVLQLNASAVPFRERRAGVTVRVATHPSPPSAPPLRWLKVESHALIAS